MTFKKALRWVGGVACGAVAVAVSSVSTEGGLAVAGACGLFFAPEAVTLGKRLADIGMSWKKPKPPSSPIS